ncbi:MAG: glycosyltransferase family A protein [Elainellaceae cyanobacterium]
MKLSVIVPCFNAESTIGVQLEAIAQQTWSDEWEVIVVDNGSTDQSKDVVEQYYQRIPQLKLLSATERKGASYARNVGAAAATGEALIFCDADDEVGPGWLTAMGNALTQRDFVTGRKENSKLNSGWLMECFSFEEGSGINETHPYLPTVGANNIGVKRSIHQAIGGFDESLRMLEDIDYGWRIQQTGAKLYYEPDALLHFRYRNNLPALIRRNWAFGVYDIPLYQKHRPYGMPKPLTWKTLVKAAIVLPIKFVKTVRDKATLSKWLMEAAWRGGQLHGCIKQRYLPL